MKIGYIKLYRKIQDSFVWLEERKFSRAEAWVDILLECNHKSKPVLISGKTYYIQRGQTCKSMLTWSNRWRWSRNKVKQFLELLEKEEQIKLEIDTRTTLITVINYEKYQGWETINEGIENENEQQKDIKRTSKGHQTLQRKDINNNVNNNKNDNNDNNKKNLSIKERKILFSDSEYFEFDKFRVKILEDEKYKDFNLHYYHEALKNWSAEGNRKLNWIATAKNWMLRDYKEKKTKGAARVPVYGVI